MFALTCEMEMGHFLALPDIVAVAANRLVAIVRVEPDGSVVVRDLANGALATTTASELSAPASAAAPTEATLSTIVQATEAQWELARRREAVVVTLASATGVGDHVASAAARLGVKAQ